MTAKNILVVFVLLALVSITCKKEISNEGSNKYNKPPIAVAGPDQVITLPTDSISLDGSASNDPDGTISNWLWKKISGPASFNFSNSLSPNTSVKNLAKGVYQFELKVTDNGGLSARDTMQVFVHDPSQPNRPPVANAGVDQTVTLPANSITINGSGSTDPDNNISSYFWTKISGPLSFTIANPNTVQTQVNNLVEGVYQFELKVTDAGGLFSRDTVKITVADVQPPQTCDINNRPLMNLQLIPIAVHSNPIEGMAIAAAGNKIVFAGGGCYCVNDSLRARVDIYDITNQTWSTSQLSVARNLISVVTNGDRIFFAGGETGDGTDPVATVDIYNLTTNEWAVSQLSTAGHSITAAAVAEKVLFAGGDGGFTGPGRDRRVDIYNLTTSSWTTAQLSEPKGGPTAVTAGNKVYFSGGYTHNNSTYSVSDKIDIYDNSTNTWSVSSMVKRRIGHGGIAVADKIYWAGGSTEGNSVSLLCSVEVNNVNTGTTVMQFLSEPSVNRAVFKNNKILFFTLNANNVNKIEIYDVASGNWSSGVLSQNLSRYGVVVNNTTNTIYITGGDLNGAVSNQVWELEF